MTYVDPDTTFVRIRQMRDELPDDDPRQKPLALEDRRIFARAVMNDSRGLAALPLLFAIPAEALQKATYRTGRSGNLPFLPTVGAGYYGLWQGIKDLFRAPSVPPNP